MKRILGCIAMALRLLSCAECETNDTRCQGNVAQICDGDGDWAELMDCDEVVGEPEVEWRCCGFESESYPEEILHGCLPAEDCVEVDG